MDVTSINWWVTIGGAVVGAVVLHVVGEYAVRGLDKSRGWIGSVWRRMSEKHQREHEDLVKYLARDHVARAMRDQKIRSARTTATHGLLMVIFLLLVVSVGMQAGAELTHGVLLGVLSLSTLVGLASALISSHARSEERALYNALQRVQSLEEET
jgi:hypothetical protein